MPALAADASQDRATAEVLGDLIDALLSESLLTVDPAPAPATPAAPPVPGGAQVAIEGERWVEVAIGDGRRLGFWARASLFPRGWRFARGPVVVRDEGGKVSGPLDAVDVVRALARPSWAALDLVAGDLAGAPAAGRRAGEAAPRVLAALDAEGLTPRTGEQLAALTDRPFHPLGRHKRGWDDRDADRWGPHARRPFGLAWWAVPRERLATGEAGEPGRPGAPGGPATVPADVLDAGDRDRIEAAMAHAGLAGDDHLVLPVHPWQVRRRGDVARGIVPLAAELGAFRASASLRTLEPAGRPDVHVKLPLAVATLGAGRQLPVRYLRNSDRAQLLLAAVAQHPALAGRVHVCEESTWWTMPADGELGCQLRRFPPALVHDPDLTLVPLAALGVTVGGRAPALEALGALGAVGTADGVAQLRQVTGELVRLAVVALGHGIMPELHGQNVVVAIRTSDGTVAGLVLRDHDAVRIHPPWLYAAGLPDPAYVVDRRTPNTLVAESPEALLAWFQMLGVHLGLHPIARALATAAGLSEADGWRAIAAATADCLDQLAVGDDGLDQAAVVARRQLLEEPEWPVKLVLGPLLERGGSCGTSMPSGVGSTANPLVGCR